MAFGTHPAFHKYITVHSKTLVLGKKYSIQYCSEIIFYKTKTIIRKHCAIYI